jgi:hypothetical protein
MTTDQTSSCGTYRCAAEEQCDDCWLIDHERECGWCEEYDHTTRRLKVQHDTGERKFGVMMLVSGEGTVSLSKQWLRDMLIVEEIADQEQKWGEERVSAND